MPEDEGTRDMQAPQYVERTGAPAFLWALVVVLSVSLGIAYGAAVGAGWGLLTFAVVQVLGTWWLLTARAAIVVDADDLVAGRGRLPLEFVGTAVALNAEETRQAAGPGADARAYLVLRASAPTAVKVVLDDPDDPTPYWLISTRRPKRLRDAILAARDAKIARSA